jgi:hypothetical protein
VSAKTMFRNSVKHWLVGSFKWDPNRAYSFVYTRNELMDELRATGASPYKAAKFINEEIGQKRG